MLLKAQIDPVGPIKETINLDFRVRHKICHEEWNGFRHPSLLDYNSCMHRKRQELPKSFQTSLYPTVIGFWGPNGSRIRLDDNFIRKYMAGTYGAVPIIG